MLKQFILGFLTLGCFQTIQAQRVQATLSHYSTDDGLASNAIAGIYQDDYGFIWMATWNGLSRFDGFNFYTFDNEADLWKFIEDVRSKAEQKNENRRDRVLALLDGRKDINLVLKKDIPMKDVAPVIKKLNEYGYRLNFNLIN